MKKILISILTILGIGLSFCNGSSQCLSGISNYSSNSSSTSAVSFPFTIVDSGSSYYFYSFIYTDSYIRNFTSLDVCYGTTELSYFMLTLDNISNYFTCVSVPFSQIRIGSSQNILIMLDSPFLIPSGNSSVIFKYSFSKAWIDYAGGSSSIPIFSDLNYHIESRFKPLKMSNVCYTKDSSTSSSCEPGSINVLYNNNNSVETITCNEDSLMQIDGLSTFNSVNDTFTPYYNIEYRDEDNQLLTESYSKNILYLSGGTFKKTYTGNNDWILNNLGLSQDSAFSGYLPTFDVVFTGDTFEDTGNIFNNFAENSLKFTLSNIPSYIQYVIILFILFFVLGFIRKFRRK